MAVFSPIDTKELSLFLNNYTIGSLKKFEGILEGIENTNYKITTSKNIYILTIFEKRVKYEDLPFFINLKSHLVKKNFICPKPISNKKGKMINTFNGKACVIVSFLKGKQAKKIYNLHCKQVGSVLASLHRDTLDFKEKRLNNMNYKQWDKIFRKCLLKTSTKYDFLFPIIKKELIFLNKNWPKKLPQGTIHADVFKDNVFFIDDKFSGLIDFYFACNDFFAYDIALAINAWCFNKSNIISINKLKALLAGYEEKRKLTNYEFSSLSILLRGAALRILLTRLHDKLFHPEGAFVKPKDPNEYFKILKFHQKTNLKNFINEN